MIKVGKQDAFKEYYQLNINITKSPFLQVAVGSEAPSEDSGAPGSAIPNTPGSVAANAMAAPEGMPQNNLFLQVCCKITCFSKYAAK